MKAKLGLTSWLVALAGILMTVEPLAAADVYYVGHISGLKFVDGGPTTITGEKTSWARHWRREPVMVPYAVLDGAGEIYVAPWNRQPGAQIEATIAARVPQGQPASGRLFIPTPGIAGMASLKFSLPAGDAIVGERDQFLHVKRTYYEELLERDIPGAAWFRHQHMLLSKELGFEVQPNQQSGRRFFGRRRANGLDDTYALVSGGRAVSENLQLDRVLPEAETNDKATVPLDEITGITIREFDWQSLVKNDEPAKDALATLIPHDQHALFFPSFQALVAVADNAEAQGATILAMAEPRAEYAMTRERYERQLGLSLNTAARLVAPQLIKTVAITGSDPYLRTGSDVAVLFETQDVPTLRKLIKTQVALAATSHPEARPVETHIDTVVVFGLRSPDRAVCSFVGTLGNAVVVTNSLAQMERLIDTFRGRTIPLATLPEYSFFRQRYRLGDKRESAFLLLTDATIQRWCGPRWRIATSRRTRAAAILAEAQAAELDQLVEGNIKVARLDSPFDLPGGGQLVFSSSGVSSDVHGSLLY